MLKRLMGMCLLTVGLATDIHAANGSSMGLSRSVDLAAPVDKVWARIGNFSDMTWASTTVTASELVAGEADVVGAQRKLTLKSGGTVTETLTMRDKKSRGYSYRIEDGTWPVAGYSASIIVRGFGTGSRVMWSSRFKLADGTAASAESEKAAKDAVAAYLDSSLGALTSEFGPYTP